MDLGVRYGGKRIANEAALNNKLKDIVWEPMQHERRPSCIAGKKDEHDSGVADLAWGYCWRTPAQQLLHRLRRNRGKKGRGSATTPRATAKGIATRRGTGIGPDACRQRLLVRARIVLTACVAHLVASLLVCAASSATSTDDCGGSCRSRYRRSVLWARRQSRSVRPMSSSLSSFSRGLSMTSSSSSSSACSRNVGRCRSFRAQRFRRQSMRWYRCWRNAWQMSTVRRTRLNYRAARNKEIEWSLASY